MMTRFKYCLVAAVFACFTLVSCSDDKLQQDGYSENSLLPFGDVNLHPLGESVEMLFTSASDWKATINGNVTLSPDHGKAGTTKIKISVGPNVTDDNREAFIDFGSQSLIVTQDKAVLSIDSVDENVNIRWQKDSRNIEVKSNIKWKYQVDKGTDWIEIRGEGFRPDDFYGEEKKMTSRDLPLNFVMNNISSSQYETRISILPVKIKNGKEETLDKAVLDVLAKTINVTQDNLYFTIDSNELGAFDYLGKDYIENQDDEFKNNHMNHTQSIVVTSEEDWNLAAIENNDSWNIASQVISQKDINLNGKKLKQTTLNISVGKPNPDTNDSRSADLDFVIYPEDGESVHRLVRVTQLKYDFECDVVGGEIFNNKGDEVKTVTIKTEGPWNISGFEAWLNHSDVKVSGKGNYSFEIVPKGQNLNFSDNEAKLWFDSSLGHKKSINLSQDKFIFDVRFENDETTLQLPRLNTSDHLMNIRSSGPWKISVSDSGDDWFTVSDSEGSGDGTLVVKANTPNPYADKNRIKTLVVESKLHKDADIIDENSKKTLQVIQDEFKFNILQSKNGHNFVPDDFESYKSGANEQTFYMECNAPWQIKNKPDWITVEPSQSDGIDYQVVTITAKNHTGAGWGQKRDGYIEISCNSGLYGQSLISKTISVKQKEFIFKVAPNSIDRLSPYNSNNDNRMITINTIDDVPWSIISDDWINTGKNSGNGSMSVSVYADNYYNTRSDRQGKIRVHCDPLNMDVPVEIVQRAYIFKPQERNFEDFDELSPVTETIGIECDGDWKVIKNADASWLKITPQSGVGNGNISITLEKNSGGSRNAEFSIVSGDGNGDLTKTYKVSQRDYVMDVTSLQDVVNISEIEGYSKEYPVRFSGRWKADSDKDFVILTQEYPEGGRNVEGKLTIEIKPNFTTVERDATINVYSADFAELKTKVTYKQNAYRWNVDSKETIEFDASAGSETIQVKCSGTWEITKVPGDTWVTVLGGGNQDGECTVKVLQNTGKDERHSTVTIKTTDGSEHSKTLKITQKGK